MCKATTKSYTIKDFRKEYPTEEACLDKIFKLVHQSPLCPKCGIEVVYKRITTRRCYQCPKCYNQLYPTAGTPFEKTTTPLTYWFYAMFLFTVSKNGMSAMELRRQIGVTYKTAWRMLKQIRLLIKEGDNLLTGVVQVDEVFIGGKNKNRHWDKKVPQSQGRSFADKTPVLGMLGEEGEVRCIVVGDTSKDTIQPILAENIKKGSTVVSDEWKAYHGLRSQYDHQIVEHNRKQYVNDSGFTTNGIEGFWSIVKRTLSGSYIQVSPKYLQLYINECSFRYNNRTNKGIFDRLLTCFSS